MMYKRKEVIGNCTLYLGDCLEVMPTLDKVDAVITDPPYGTTACKWDSIIPFDDMWDCLNACTKENSAIALFGSEPFSSYLRLSNIKQYKYDWVWDKKRVSNFLNSKIQPLRAVELISIFYKKQCLYNPQYKKRKHKRDFSNQIMKPQSNCYGKQKNYISTIDINSDGYPTNLISIRGLVNNEYEKVNHPTQKPIELMEYLIKTYTNKSETVLDFTMGSGTTLVACAKTGRHGIGIELDQAYFDITCRRVEDAYKQGDLFI